MPLHFLEAGEQSSVQTKSKNYDEYITVIIILIILIICRPLPYEVPGSVMLSDLSPTDKEREREVYETIEADHEYEILDKYNQPQYDDVKVLPPKPEPAQPQPLSVPAGDYEFTQCPAYVPVATTSNHGNTHRSVDPPSAQPTTAQDDQKNK